MHPSPYGCDRAQKNSSSDGESPNLNHPSHVMRLSSPAASETALVPGGKPSRRRPPPAAAGTAASMTEEAPSHAASLSEVHRSTGTEPQARPTALASTQ